MLERLVGDVVRRFLDLISGFLNILTEASCCAA